MVRSWLRDYQAWALGLGRRFWRVRSLGGMRSQQAVTRRLPSGKRYTGHLLRAQYQKNFVSLGTAFSLGQLSLLVKRGYYDFAEASPLKAPRSK
ncbi:hypothetical protein LNP74_20620 [Klebsiella pneumoniae subsp. pneumoniae]|nr:hypothetical protein [Klebsiella pneumoniae subsp. pneumoniae]